MPHYLSDEEILQFAEDMLETYSQQDGFEDVAAMVADFFRRDGWDVLSSHDLNRADVLRAVRKEWFDVVAVSISAPNQVVSSSTLISDIRKLSSNKGILVMVGGPLALSVPDLATRVGADMVTLDAKQAVDVAGRAVPVRRTSVAN